MRMRVLYLHCHEAGLCCYLAIHVENLLRTLQLFYFHLLPIYGLSLVNILRSLKWYIPFRISDKNVTRISHLFNACYIPH
jgi:hypothetical protein